MEMKYHFCIYIFLQWCVQYFIMCAMQNKNIPKNISYLFPENSSELHNFEALGSEESTTDDYSNEYSSSTTLRTSTASGEIRRRKAPPCYDYYEYCTNQNITYKYQLHLQGKMSFNVTPDRLGERLYKMRCHCDPQCHFYGDCCFDQLTIDEITAEPVDILHNNGLRWECQRLPIKNKENYKDIVEILVVASCPSDFDDENVVSRCTRNVSSSPYHYSLDVPFLSQDTNITYVNIYCAICNNDTHVHRWNVKIHCGQVPNCTNDVSHWTYQNGKKRWVYNDGNITANITYELSINTFNKTFYEMFGARKCRTEVIRNCPPQWTDEHVQNLCSAYSLVVRSNSNRKLYKNEHCAVCHGQERSNTNLVCPVYSRTTERPVGSTPAKTHSYALLMDFYGDGNRVGEKRTCGPQGEFRCTFGEICDFLQKSCRPYTCGRKYQMNSAGECILLETNTSMSGMDKKCPKMYVHRPDFVNLPHHTIYINASATYYSESEHEYVNESTVLICASYDFGKFSKIQSILSVIGISISLICLAIHILIHLFVPQLRNLHGKNLISLSCSLFISQSFFEFGLNINRWFPLCEIVGMTVHFGFLASFFWMNVMAIDVWRTFASKSYRPSSDEVWKEYGKYSLYAWLTPFIIVMLAFINDQLSYLPTLRPQYGRPLCWINNRNALLIFFAGPLALMLLENMILFLLTIRGIYKVAKVSKIARQYSTANGQGIANDRTRMLLYAKLALIMGLTWIFSFVAALADLEIMWYLFIIFNSLQGAFIFIAFSCKRKVLRLAQTSFRRVVGLEKNVSNNKILSSQTQSTKVLTFLSASIQNLTRIKEAAT